MAGLKLNHIYKVYPNGAKAVSDFTMDIEDKEFIIFVGPSGCGKSTTLRMIAGLEEITSGELSIDGTVVNNIEPKDRDIAMVFQNYALYPHMTVYKNMAFGLKLRKTAKDEIDKRVKEAAEILGITEYLNKKPGEMSGGQRQRVALGRAIVREPKVFLLDEPLSNLDAKLRTQMRSEILKLHRRLQTTFIYVTHDQIEAMTMGTRIVVMKDGFVQQIDTPRNLYNHPCNKFVAGFIGTPQMNFFNARLKKEKDGVRITLEGANTELWADISLFTKINPAYLDGEKAIVLGLRSEHISTNAKAFPYSARCRISHYEDLGTDCQVYADFNTENSEFDESCSKVVMKAPAGSVYASGEIIDISLDLSHMHLFDAETEATISPRIPELTSIPCTVNGNNLQLLETVLPLPEAIALPDGDYTIQLPPEAITVSSSSKSGAAAVFEGEERINNSRLLKLSCGGHTLYSLSCGDAQLKTGKTVYFTIDLKRADFINDGNECVQRSLPLDNSLNGKLIKRKAVEERTDANGKIKKDKGFVIDISTADYTAELPDEFGIKLLSSGDMKQLFLNEMQFHFTPYSVKLAENGISARVDKVLDYGSERFAACTVGKDTVIVAAEGVNEGNSVHLQLDYNRLSVFDTVREILLV